MDRRLGKFMIPMQMIKEIPDDVRLIMGQVIVLDADYKVESDRIEYLAICDQFAEAPRGAVPRYYAVVVSDGVVSFTADSLLSALYIQIFE